MGGASSRVLAAIAAGTLLAAASGCGDDELVGLDRVGRADAPKVLKLQINADYSPQAATPSAAEGFRKLFAEWARRHPDWRLDLNIIPGSMSTTEQARLLEKARVGQAPDCGNVDSFTVPLFVEQGALKPLDEHFGQREVDDLLPYVREVITGPDDSIYAWWFSTDLRVIYRRTDLVPNAPRTWDELIQYGKEAVRKDPNVDGYLFNGGRWEAATFDNLGYFWSQGGELLDREGRPVFAEGSNREAMRNVLAFLKRTVDEGVSPSRVTTIINYDEFQTAAEGGSVAMFLGGSWQWGAMEEALGKEAMRDWEVSELPGRRAGQTATGTGGWAMGAFSDDPEKVAACASLIKEIYVGPSYELTGELATSQRLLNTLEVFQTPIARTYQRFLEHGRARPGLAIYPALSNELQIAIGSVLTGSATPEEALDTAGDRVSETYDILSGGDG
jgi:multiple sugar transport system substrate-binding protein